jgi:hypothetical protein
MRGGRRSGELRPKRAREAELKAPARPTISGKAVRRKRVGGSTFVQGVDPMMDTSRRIVRAAPVTEAVLVVRRVRVVQVRRVRVRLRQRQVIANKKMVSLKNKNNWQCSKS